MAKKKNWLQKEINWEKSLSKNLEFRNNDEYIIFLVWALFVSVFLLSIK